MIILPYFNQQPAIFIAPQIPILPDISASTCTTSGSPKVSITSAIAH